MSTTANTRIPLRPDPSALVSRALELVAKGAVDAARIAFATRSAVTPLKISDATALATIETFFLPSLVPASAAASVLDQSLKFSFDGAAQISVPGISLPAAAWVGESAPIPVVQGTSTAGALLSPSKLAVLVALTAELISGADAETTMSQLLLEGAGGSLDAAFFSAAAAVPGVSPAGILNGAIVVTAATAGAGAMAQDIGNLAQALAPVSGASGIIIVAAPKQAAVLKTVAIDPPSVFASNTLAPGTVVGIVPSAIASASSAPDIAISRETTLHMAAPAGEIVASPSTVAAPQRSVFQTDSVALRFRQELSWARRGPGVAMITGANWP